MRSRARLWVAVVLGLVAGCDDDLRTLTRDDVSDVPAGDAVGMQFSGQYLLTSNTIEGCDCRRGSCATLHGVVGATLMVTQTDGALQMTDPLSLVLAHGGVDADGDFTLGFLIEELDNVQYALLQGRFASSGGTPTSMSGLQEATTHQSVYDCDVRLQFVAAYQGPPPAAFVEAPGTEASGLGPVTVTSGPNR